MRLERKLARWQKAGLIDEQVAQSISDYEASSSSPVVLWAAGGLGAFAIITGIVSVIAANWLHTPDEVKLGIDLILCAVLALVVYRVCVSVEATQEKLWLRETLVTVYYGFTLASMGLIGQTYQLGGSIAKLLLVWTIATIPLVLLARGRFIAVLWCIAAATTYGMNIEPLYEFVKDTLGFEQEMIEITLLSIVLTVPLQFVYLSRLGWLSRNRPVFATVISRVSWLAIIVAGFFLQFLWYESGVFNGFPIAVLVITGAAVAVTLFFIPALYRDSPANSHLAMRAVLASVYVLGATACWHDSELNVVGAFTNLVYLCILAWAALKIGSTPLFNFVTAAISIRILFVYFEVFGSMMQTGVGLIVGGLLTLLLAWLWLKKSSNLAQQLAGGAIDE